MPARADVCDVDDDGDVDSLDIGLITSARNQPALVDDPRDPDGDGVITVRDARTCVGMCTLSRCTIVTPSENTPPEASAGGDVTVPVGTTVTLDGSGSQDPDGDTLTYAWTITERPVDSVAILNNPTNAAPQFTVDKAGTYRIQLVVNDGEFNSAPDSVEVTAQQLDDDGDGVPDSVDQCPDTPTNETADATGCSPSQSDTQAPTLSITSPADGALVTVARPKIRFDYSDQSEIDIDSLAVDVNGARISAVCSGDQSEGVCTPGTDLPNGDVTVTGSVADILGNSATAEIQIVVDSSPVGLFIASPANGLITADGSIAVSGTTDVGVSSVRVNDIDATVNNGVFIATIPLREGKNMLVAIATRDNGKTAVRTVDITRDIVAPIVTIDSPRDGFNSIEDQIAVTGLVNDIVSGGIDARVVVNGVEATVSDGTFLIVDLTLIRGPNIIEAVATDAVGNQSSNSITVNFNSVVGNRIEVLSGNGQAELTNQTLPQPLVVEVKDDLGNPVAGSVVKFEVTRNSGLIRSAADDSGARILRVPTNGSGRASVLFQLGDTAGEGNNRMTATSVGVAGEAVFCASALASSATEIQMVAGDNQRGIIGQPLAQALEALVIDKDGNPIKNLPVIFSVLAGGGDLDGQNSISRLTGSDGIARAVLNLGPDPGINNNLVQATFVGATTLSATYLASGVAPGNPADTQFTGVVLDNAHTPIPGAIVTIINSVATSVTDSEGQFLLENVPVGRVQLHIDPTGSPRPETFPPLEFETVTIPGQVNILGQPILLPAVQLQNSKVVGGPDDVTIFMPGVDGMSVKVKAGSATFPNGDATGQLSISQVHMDKVPMPPPNGSLFMPPAWTIQPAGVKFDPPAEITIPNDGLPPGRIIDIFQFDHTLNQFINVGKGVVSDDASDIVSDNGFGITRTGWGGCGLPPPPDTCTRSCSPGPTPANECEEVVSPDCPGCPFLVPADPSKLRNEQTPNDCSKNTCGGPEFDPDDPAEDDPRDCVDPVCEGDPPPDDGETPEDDCQVCQGGAPQPDPSNDGNVCKDGCGVCVDGSCDVVDPRMPKEVQTPNDCKTELCDGTTEANEGDAPTDDCKICQGTEIVDAVDTPRENQTANNCQVEMCDGSFNPDSSDRPPDVADDCEAVSCFIDFAGQTARLISDLEPSDHNTADVAGDCAVPLCTTRGSSATTLTFFGADPPDQCSICTGVNQSVPRTTDLVSTNVCSEYSCNPANGLFSLTPKADNAPTGNQCLVCNGAGGTRNNPGTCDDGNSCTINDTCSGGTCTGTLDTSIPGCTEEDDSANDVTVRLTMFIPADHVTMPAHPFIPLIWDDFVFTGDNRSFMGNNFTYWDQEAGGEEPLPQEGGVAFRLAQEFTFRPGVGAIVRQKNLSGTTMRFDIPTSMTDGSTAAPSSCYRKNCPNCTPYPFGRPMTVPGECITLSARRDTNLDGRSGVEKEDEGPADTSSMQVSPVGNTGSTITFLMTGNPANDFVPWTPEFATFSITWDILVEFTLSDEGDRVTSWRVFGDDSENFAHDAFPAYEMEINKTVIHTFDPIPNGNNPSDLFGVIDSSRVQVDLSGTAGL